MFIQSKRSHDFFAPENVNVNIWSNITELSSE